MEAESSEEVLRAEHPISAEVNSLSIDISWGQEGCGFGQLYLSLQEHPTELAKTLSGGLEFMPKEWVRKALYAAVDSIVDKIPDGSVDSFSVSLPYSEAEIQHIKKLNEALGIEDDRK